MENQKFFVKTKGLGITETLGFNMNFASELDLKIEIENVRVNPKNRRVLFCNIKDKKILKSLRSFFNEKISSKHIAHNEFAFYNYQLVKS